MLRKDKTKSDRRDVYVDHNIRLKTVGIGAKKKKKKEASMMQRRGD